MGAEGRLGKDGPGASTALRRLERSPPPPSPALGLGSPGGQLWASSRPRLLRC